MKNTAEISRTPQQSKPVNGRASYRNPWYTPHGNDPETYRTDAKPVAYRGFTIFHRVKSSNPSGNCHDLVKDGECIGQMVTLAGAKLRADAYLKGAKTTIAFLEMQAESR